MDYRKLTCSLIARVRALQKEMKDLESELRDERKRSRQFQDAVVILERAESL